MNDVDDDSTFGYYHLFLRERRTNATAQNARACAFLENYTRAYQDRYSGLISFADRRYIPD